MTLRLLVAVLALAPAASGVLGAQGPLDAVADALGGRERIDGLTTMVVRSRTAVPLGGRRVTVRSAVSVRFPGLARWSVTTGGAPRVVVARPDGVTALGDPARGVSPRQAAAVRQALWLDPVVLAVRRAEVEAQAAGPSLLRLAVPSFPEPVLLRLDDAGRPALATTFRPAASGGREYVEVRYEDYRTVDGVAVPHRVVQAVGGVETGATTVGSVAFGAALPQLR